MRLLTLFAVISVLVLISASLCFSNADNSNPSDTFSAYQVALREENTSLLTQVFVIQNLNSMSQSRILQELRYLKRYDSFKNYAITQVLQKDNIASVKVKGTLHGREGVKRTFRMRSFADGWKIVNVLNQ